jgi:hypothetical protein
MTVLSLHCFFVSAGAKFDISVLIYPGDTVLTRAKPVHSTARLLPKVGSRSQLCAVVMLAIDSQRIANGRRSYRLTKVDDSSLGAVVHSLQLRYVDDTGTHGSSGNETARGKVLEGLALQIGTLLLLAAEVCAG